MFLLLCCLVFLSYGITCIQTLLGTNMCNNFMVTVKLMLERELSD